MARCSLNTIPCPVTALTHCFCSFLFFVTDVFVWESWCLLFILLLLCTCIHLSSLLWTSNGSSRLVVFYIHLSWNLGVLRAFCCFMRSFSYAFNKWNPLPCLDTLKWTLTPAIRQYKCVHIVQLEAYTTVCFNALNGFNGIVSTQRNILCIHYLSSFPLFSPPVHVLRKIVCFFNPFEIVFVTFFNNCFNWKCSCYNW